MAIILADRVKVRTRTVGTATFLIEAALPGFQDFEAVGDGNETYYGVFDNIGNWEIGRGIYNSLAKTLTRDNVISSSNNGNKINFPVGAKTLYTTLPSSVVNSISGNTQSDSFKNIVVAGQNTLIADGPADTLTIIAGQNISLQTNDAADSLTINFSGDYKGSVFADDSSVIVDGLTGTVYGDVRATTLRTSETKIALGGNAGLTNQGVSTVAIGGAAGQTNQGASAIAIGALTAQTNQGVAAVSVGALAGQIDQGGQSVAVGPSAGSTTQGLQSVAIGNLAGSLNQGQRAVAVGSLAGANGQGDYAVALGNFAGGTNQPANSIVINASGVALNGSAAGLFVDPIRSSSGTGNILQYDTSTKEISYSSAVEADLVGSVFADNSTLLVDAVSGSIPWSVIADIPTEGNTYYVSVNGSNSNSGKTTEKAYRTLKYALSQTTVGDIIHVCAGEFLEEFPMTVPKGVTVKGSGIRATTIRPTVPTRDKDCFLLNGETTIEDLTIRGMLYNTINDTGYAFRFADPCVIDLRSPYIQRITVLNTGSVVSGSDPYGFNQGDAGRGAYLDGSKVTRSSLEAAILFNECTFIVPNSRALIMTNGARSEWLNCFTYFADLAIEGVVGAAGRGGDGKTYIGLSGVTGTFNVGNTLSFYADNGVTVLASGTIEAVNGNTYQLDGSVSGFLLDTDRNNKPITRNGDAQLSVARQKFGSASLALDGTGDYLSLASDNDFGWGTGDFTLEGWFWKNSASQMLLFDQRTSGSSQLSVYVESNAAGNLRLFVNGSYVLTSSNAMTTGAWNHVAISRASGTTRFFINGTVSTTTYADTNDYGTAKPLVIGATWSGSTAFNGNIDEIRVSKGIARYTGTFTPATSEFVGDSSTVLLLHFNGTNGSTNIVDDGITIQDIRSSSGGTATGIVRYDRSEFAAELRSIAGANVYGNQGVKADGIDVVLQLMAHNFAYIGTGADLTNNKSTVVQANEVIELNNGRVFYNSVDQKGDYRIGDYFTVDFETGSVSFSGATFDITSLTGITFTDGSNVTTVNPLGITTGNLTIAANTISSNTGNININPSGDVVIQAGKKLVGAIEATGSLQGYVVGALTGNVTADDSTVIINGATNTVTSGIMTASRWYKIPRYTNVTDRNTNIPTPEVGMFVMVGAQLQLYNGAWVTIQATV